MKDYYIVSFKHIGNQDNSFEFWGENSSGYTRAIENAGLYELPENLDEDYQKSMHKKYVHKDIIDKLKQKIILAKSGDYQEKYAGLSEFFVLPNTGQVRRELELTKLDFNIDGNRDSFNAYFKDTCYEKYKYVKQENIYVCSLKENNPFIGEYWYYQNEEYNAKTRDSAIFKFIKDRELDYCANEWQFKNRDRYYDRKEIEMKDILLAKKYVSCKIKKIKVLDKWEDIK